MAGDNATLTKARRELEELYSGIPDDSVNLTFQDFAQVKQLPVAADHHSNRSYMERKLSGGSIITSKNTTVKSSSPLSKLPSLDFSKAIEETSIISNHNNNLHHHDSTLQGRKLYSPSTDHYGEDLHKTRLGNSTIDPLTRVAAQDSSYNAHHGHGVHKQHHHQYLAHDGHISDNHTGHHQANSNTASGGHHHHGNTGFHSDHHHDSISGASSMMMSNSFMDPIQGSIGGTRRRRPGIPHSNICSICSVYIYLFRDNRCLVCGRVYCRQCVSIGMGEKTEGRKCIQCLGKRFSQRYIGRAGKTGGCCIGFLDSTSSSRVKQQELLWAEKGAKKSGNNTNATGTPSTYNYSTNYSRSEVSPRTPTKFHGQQAHRASPPSFVASSNNNSPSPYSPYSYNASPATSYHFPL